MTTNHLPQNPLRPFTWQTFGFVSAAEGFVFLSGLVAGWVYGRTAVDHGVKAATWRVLRRAALIYLANSVLITFGILADKEDLAEIGNGFQPNHILWVKSMLFITAPGYAEILRLYCIFFVFLPLILWALVSGRFRYVALISAGLWLVASLGYGMALFPETFGYFDIMSWQLLFVVGIYFGFRLLREHKVFQMLGRPLAALLSYSCSLLFGTGISSPEALSR